MDYIIFNSNGSINERKINQYIQQGSTGVNKIFVSFPNTSNVLCQAVFSLPNNTNVTEMGVAQNNFEYKEDHFADGWIITLLTEETTYNGLVMVAIRILESNVVYVNYPFTLIINETGVRPDTDSGVTLEELDSYLAILQDYAKKDEIRTILYHHNLQCFNSDEMGDRTYFFLFISTKPSYDSVLEVIEDENKIGLFYRMDAIVDSDEFSTYGAVLGIKDNGIIYGEDQEGTIITRLGSITGNIVSDVVEELPL